MKGLDGIQGPVYVGTALYGYEPPKGPKRPKMISCGCCPCFGRRRKSKHESNGDIAVWAIILVTSTLMEDGGVPPSSSPAVLLTEAIHVISCGYEDKTEWGGN
ncbi:hypothetical protein YC2023_014258 [Brassica napus]